MAKITITSTPKKAKILDLTWSTKDGFRVGKVKEVETLPDDLGIDPIKHRVRLAITVNRAGDVEVTGLNRQIRAAGGVVTEGRCFGG